MGYLTHFVVYILAMLSVIGIALFVYKKFSISNIGGKKSGSLAVEEVLSLSPRKTLYVVNANGEKFLIAGDLERTTLISKLNNNINNAHQRNYHNPVDLSEFIKKEDDLMSSNKQPVMKNLVKKLGKDSEIYS